MFKLLLSVRCSRCEVSKKSPPRPVVGLSMAQVFNETVAIQKKLKKRTMTWFLHMIDHATRNSTSSVVKSKKKVKIVVEISKIWIKIFGCPKKILVDNRGEFDNEIFGEFCKNMEVFIKNTTAEIAWRDGIVEKHNGVIEDSVVS